MRSCDGLFHSYCYNCYNIAKGIGGLIERVRRHPILSHTYSIDTDHVEQYRHHFFSTENILKDLRLPDFVRCLIMRIHKYIQNLECYKIL